MTTRPLTVGDVLDQPDSWRDYSHNGGSPKLDLRGVWISEIKNEPSQSSRSA